MKKLFALAWWVWTTPPSRMTKMIFALIICLTQFDVSGQLLTNQFPNPGFEDGTIAPFGEGATNAATLLSHTNLGLGNVRSGNHSLSFTTSGNSSHTFPWFGARFGNVFATIDAAKDYRATLSIWVKGPAGTQVKTFVFFNASGLHKHNNSGLVTLTGDWQEITVSYESPLGEPFDEATGRLDVFTPNVTVYFDDPTFIVEENVFPNPGFEDGTIAPFGEGATNGATLLSHTDQGLGNVRTGNHSLSFTTSGNSSHTFPWFGTRFGNAFTTIDPTKDYKSTFSIWVKGPAGTVVRSFVFYNASGLHEHDNSGLVTLTGDWQNITVTYESPLDQPFDVATGRLDVFSPNVTVYFDDPSFYVEEVVPSNLWSDPQTWSPDPVPDSTTNVVIAVGKTVILDTNAKVRTLKINGTLTVDRSQDLNLTADHILVEGANAMLDWGTATDPYLRKSVITLTDDVDSDESPSMGFKFLAAHMGGEIQMHGSPAISWSQLGANAVAGSTQITMKEPVNWKIGDEIVIAPSRWYNQTRIEAEKRIIDSISTDRTVLTLDTALQYPHHGTVQSFSEGGRNWEVDLRAEVGLLTHNILIQGDAASELDSIGGHIMLHMGASGYFSGVELYNMGQKKKLGRYPFHWHQLRNVAGQYFNNSSVHQSYNRAITIHSTDSALVSNNFFYDHQGHGVFFEDGTEIGNTVTGNVTLLTVRPLAGDELVPSDNQLNQAQNRTPASYWITNPNNFLEDNVAAGTQGTGFWFAFPTANDTHRAPLGSFKRNRAHSCSNGFDIFDHLDSNDSIITNGAWFDDGDHVMEDCQWYANEIGVYTGSGVNGPTDNLIFRNNVFMENIDGMRLASNNVVEESLIAARSGESLIVTPNTDSVSMYVVYDGPGQLINNYMVGWNLPNTHLFRPSGAAIKHPNHILSGNVADGALPVKLPNYDLDAIPVYDPRFFPHLWINIWKDLDGNFSGKANTSIVSNHPFQLVGDEFVPSGWENALRSDHQFVMSLIRYIGLGRDDFPNVTVTRKQNGTVQEENVYYLWGLHRARTQLPFIVNEGYEYIYQYESLPANQWVRMRMIDATVGDDYIAQFKDFGKLEVTGGGGPTVTSDQTLFTQHNTLATLKNATESGYYVEPQGDLYIKAIATAREQFFDIQWDIDFDVPPLDTDGDQMSDSTEISLYRHPFRESDLASEFETNGDFEGWTQFNDITGEEVLNGILHGLSSGPDARIINDAFGFSADSIAQIDIRIKSAYTSFATGNMIGQLYFTTDTSPNFSEDKSLSFTYNADDNWQTLSFLVRTNLLWTGTITSLRLDPVNSGSVEFDIDWIRSTTGVSSRPSTNISNSESTTSPKETEGNLTVYPNPFSEVVSINLGEVSYHTFQLLDLKGKVLYTHVLDKGVREIHLQAEDLPVGLYILQFEGNQHSRQVKIMKE